MLVAAGGILSVRYKSMKCDILSLQGSVSTYLGKVDIFHVCVNIFLLTTLQNYKKRSRFSKVLITNVLPLIMVYSVYTNHSCYRRPTILCYQIFACTYSC